MRFARGFSGMMLVVAAVGLLYTRMPTSFLPNEDQGYLIVNVQLPPGATVERTTAVMQQVEGFFLLFLGGQFFRRGQVFVEEFAVRHLFMAPPKLVACAASCQKGA